MSACIEIQPTFSHLSPNSSMVTASHRRSEGCGFESRLGTQIFLIIIFRPPLTAMSGFTFCPVGLTRYLQEYPHEKKPTDTIPTDKISIDENPTEKKPNNYQIQTTKKKSILLFQFFFCVKKYGLATLFTDVWFNCLRSQQMSHRLKQLANDLKLTNEMCWLDTN